MLLYIGLLNDPTSIFVQVRVLLPFDEHHLLPKLTNIDVC
jgi:hypothetical protein